jgi:hypothetical protein
VVATVLAPKSAPTTLIAVITALRRVEIAAAFRCRHDSLRPRKVGSILCGLGLRHKLPTRDFIRGSEAASPPTQFSFRVRPHGPTDCSEDNGSENRTSHNSSALRLADRDIR